MFNKFVFGLSWLVLLSSCFVYSGFGGVVVRASHDSPVRNLDTGLEYATIQEAIDAPETLDGHTIFVGEGTYYEHLVVNKSLSLVGENMSTTVIDGNYTGNPVAIGASHVNVTGFTVQKATYPSFPPYMGYPFYGYAIYVGEGTAYGNISHNIIADNPLFGIMVNESSHNVISDDILRGNNASDVTLWNSDNNVVFNNTLENVDSMSGDVGVAVLNSTENEVYDNLVVNNTGGIVLELSGGNRIYENNMTSNLYGFWMIGYSASDYNNSIDMSNLVDGKHIYCLQGAKNVVLGSLVDAATVYLVDCENVTVKDLVLKGNGYGLLLWETNDTRIENVTASSNVQGVNLGNCTNVTIRGCSIADNVDGGVFLNSSVACKISENDVRANSYSGVRLEYSSDVTIDGNNVTGTSGDGLMIAYGENNSVSGNLIEENLNGVRVFAAYGDVLYHNSFVHNHAQVEIYDASSCVWDRESEGNYWSDYAGTDSNHDGLGDTPYAINADNVDHYPLVTPYSYWGNAILGDVDRDKKVDMRDVASAASRLGSRAGDPGWNPRADVTGPAHYVPDGVVDVRDLVAIAKNFGKHYA